MWDCLLEPGALRLIQSNGRHLAGFFQELTHFAVHHRRGAVLWCDGNHGFNPYDFAELNLTRGHQANVGADRVLVKRCMTAFQWDSALRQHIDLKLQEDDAALVVVNPFNGLWSHEEIQDWEQEDYTRFSLKHLHQAARRFNVPILLGVDVRWWQTHPTLAQATHDAADERWNVTAPQGRWKAVREDGLEVDPFLRHRTTLLDFMPQPLAVEVPARLATQRNPWGAQANRPPLA